ncbi:efflux RND transporter permease subunit [Candidatus Midichloria mitochondrii]|uniref:efflux RND transporter permease subunit n=1 Tax=Candidatus Midichloria mitochondrii TaxID=234827 RepID=UPI0011D18187|nr:efflux RND transporter permease subunit [Candidatus Midichloria mitochondrii]
MSGVGSRGLISYFVTSCFILSWNFISLTLNIVVLFSLILTVGMIVDDAIVVSEYADRKMADGHELQIAFSGSSN